MYINSDKVGQESTIGTFLLQNLFGFRQNASAEEVAGGGGGGWGLNLL